MNRFTNERRRAIKQRVEAETGAVFASERRMTETGGAPSAGRRFGAPLRIALVAILVLVLGTVGVFAAKGFRLSSGFLGTPGGMNDPAACRVNEPDGAVDPDGNGASQRTNASGMTENEARGFAISAPFSNEPVGPGSKHHDGVDFAAEKGTPVLAAAAGTIAETGFVPSYGNYVMIDHDYGYRTVYAHLSAIAVEAGDAVEEGDAIGAVGATGMATGPCLHFELRLNGEPVDPAEYWN